MEEEGGLRDLAKKAAAKVVAANGGAPPKGTTYIGVRLPRWGKWSAEIRDSPTSIVWLGIYDTAVEAACAYDAAVRTLRPHRARGRTNFPEPPETTGEEREARAAVVRAHVDEVKRKRAEKEARRREVAEAAVAEAAPPPAPAADPEVDAPTPEGDASPSETSSASPGGDASGASTSPSTSAAAAPEATNAMVVSTVPSPAVPALAVNAHASAFRIAVSTNAPQAQQSLDALRSLAQLQEQGNLRPPLTIGNPPQSSASRQELRTTGGCTMANIPPAQFQDLYRRFLETCSGLGDGGSRDPDLQRRP